MKKEQNNKKHHLSILKKWAAPLCSYPKFCSDFKGTYELLFEWWLTLLFIACYIPISGQFPYIRCLQFKYGCHKLVDTEIVKRFEFFVLLVHYLTLPPAGLMGHKRSLTLGQSPALKAFALCSSVTRWLNYYSIFGHLQKWNLAQ